jgi:hypothetical protein
MATLGTAANDRYCFDHWSPTGSSVSPTIVLFASAPELPRSLIFVEFELDFLQGLQDCVTEWGRWFVKRHPPPNMNSAKFYTPEDMFVNAAVERNTLLQESAGTEEADNAAVAENGISALRLGADDVSPSA